MKRIVVTLVLLGIMGATVQPALAHDWGYAPYPYRPGHQETPVLQKVLVGGALIGLGFAAGRLTAPRPQYDYRYGYQPAPRCQPSFGYRPAPYGFAPRF